MRTVCARAFYFFPSFSGGVNEHNFMHRRMIVRLTLQSRKAAGWCRLPTSERVPLLVTVMWPMPGLCRV